ncbi:retrovirus-related pol polyprotein from transposon TNT 1-94 [Tanacetum coccineum]
MMGNRKLFSSYKAYNGGNVIFGSNLRGNIIGKGQICDNNCRVTFSEHDSEITKDGKVICRGIRKKGLYVIKSGNKPKDQICLATIDENFTLWHRRLGHANMRLIQSLASKELVRNLPKLKFDQHFCDACKIGKQAHASHKAKNIVSMTRCFELLHMDLFGPSAVRSYGGNRYTLVIVDDYSREFDNEVQFGEFCNANGITHNFSAPRTPQSNGVVERKNRTLQEMKPKNVNEALTDDSWIVAMQEELNQFIANDVWELVPQPRNMTIIGTKWVFRNKLDENGIVSRNKARLESIRILLAYACALDFKLFQMDVKSAFLNCFINEEVYVAQPSGFIDFEKPDHVYKLKKALYGLKQAPKAWWSLDELAYGVPTDGPYQTNPPSHDDIILSIRIDREGQVCRIHHEEEIMNIKFSLSYVWYDRVMNPLTAQQEQKIRKDRGTRRGRHSTFSSSAFDQLSSSHLNDDDDDGNGERTSRASTLSPIRYVNSLTNEVP